MKPLGFASCTEGAFHIWRLCRQMPHGAKHRFIYRIPRFAGKKAHVLAGAGVVTANGRIGRIGRMGMGVVCSANRRGARGDTARLLVESSSPPVLRNCKVGQVRPIRRSAKHAVGRPHGRPCRTGRRKPISSFISHHSALPALLGRGEVDVVQTDARGAGLLGVDDDLEFAAAGGEFDADVALRLPRLQLLAQDVAQFLFR